MIEPKPCRDCGRAPRIEIDCSEEVGYLVLLDCERCDGWGASNPDRDTAIEQWNEMQSV